ncbi:MAG TPA: response regulator, partial [Nannocystaceae bacterium]|nr:response regulator [Nannocystaceae bacterium]
MTGKIRVLVVDDSAFARQVVRRVLERAGDLEVVGIARDGAEALEKVTLLQPDVVTLDLVMPGIDGLGVLEALPRDGGPRVVVVSSASSNSELGIAALA